MTDTQPDLNATEARQGRRGRHVLLILVVSLALVVVAFAVIWMTHADDLANKNGNANADPAAAANFTAPEQMVKQDDQMKAPGVPASQSPSPEAGAQ